MSKIYHCYYDSCAKESDELPSILYLKKKGQVCFYDSKRKIFVDTNLDPLDITGIKIIPHSSITVAKELQNKIKENGGIIPGEIEKEEIVKNWIDLYTPKRKIRKITGQELLDPKVIETLKETYGEQIFFKTIEKSYHSTIKLNDLKDPKTVISRALKKHENEEFIISELVEIEKDELGNKEYRIFIFEGQILNISRHTECFLHKIEPEIYESAQQILKKCKKISFPSSYVVDLFKYKDQNGNTEVDVVEFNPFSSSGRYLYNSIDHLPTDDMLHDEPTNIAIEKRPLVSLCLVPDKKYKSYIDRFSSSIYCGVPDSFAYDLKELHEYKNIVDFTTNFDLGRHIEEYEEKKASVQNNGPTFSPLVSDMQKIMQDARIKAEEYAAEEFIRSLGFEECPIDEMYLVKSELPKPEITETPEFIQINPETLKRLMKKAKK